jgi:hypothetical protein
VKPLFKQILILNGWRQRGFPQLPTRSILECRPNYIGQISTGASGKCSLTLCAKASARS